MLQLRAHISFSLPHFVAAAAAAAAAAVFSVRIAFSLIFSYSGHKEQEDDGKSVPGFARARWLCPELSQASNLAAIILMVGPERWRFYGRVMSLYKRFLSKSSFCQTVLFNCMKYFLSKC